MTLFNLLTSWSIGPRIWSVLWPSSVSACRSVTKPPVPALEPSDLCLQDILKSRATSGKGAIICYANGNTSAPRGFSYLELYNLAGQYSRALRAIPSFKECQPVLLHFDEHWDTIVWFWATLLANGVPVLSSPFSNNEAHRHQHIQGLSDLLQTPICITRSKLVEQFDGAQSSLQLHTVESLCHNASQSGLPKSKQNLVLSSSGIESQSGSLKYPGGQSLAMLMLTSGSTGVAKAVCLSHKQIFAAVSGKASVRPLHRDGAFLNWIGLDHVASLVEIHIQALWLDVEQVHVHAADIVSSPRIFLDLLSRHRVCRTFAPNFFLGRLVSTMRSESALPQDNDAWDLSNLQIVASGGEANDMKTCVAAASLFHKYGASRNVITPGFGMTETCAGAIFNLACPDYDSERGYAVASLGTCMKGIEMRVISGSSLAARGEPGDLEVRGDVVFGGYYRNLEATADAFPSQDGWFRTGDQACIDSNGNLRLIGRKKDVVNINGIKTGIADIDSVLEQALGERVTRFVVFPSRSAHTEQITIGYIPKGWPHAPEEMIEIDELASQVCITSASARPLVFSFSETSTPLLPTSSLGKISRARMTSLYEAGVFHQDITMHQQRLDRYRKEIQHRASSLSDITEDEAVLIDDFAKTLCISIDEIGPNTRVFELGFTSMDLIRLKRRIDIRLGITLPVITLMTNPTARLLAAALQTQPCFGTVPKQSDQAMVNYDPVVTLKSSGTETPLWLVHPGVGEILVFVGLAQQLGDTCRPIYALRARGFEAGQTQFSSITEAVDIYVQAIRKRQPQGPYALAGYSYGTMLAFEVAKRLDAMADSTGTTGNSVRFLGSFNLPPHIKSRMRQLRWNMCLLHLTQFLGLISEGNVEDMEQMSSFSAASKEEALGEVIRAANRDRMEELGLEVVALARWVDVAYGLQSMAVEYEPGGQVACIDVFHAIPLKQAAASREEWVVEHLSKWRDFSRTEPRMHPVGGAHYTMIGPEHVVDFAAKLKEALRSRGV